MPESIGKLSNLQLLFLANNNLTSLWVDKKPCFLSSPMVMNRKSETFSIHAAPESMGSLSNLRELYLNKNNLTILPESIATLIKTKDLGLDESSYEINNLSMDCHTLVLTDITPFLI